MENGKSSPVPAEDASASVDERKAILDSAIQLNSTARAAGIEPPHQIDPAELSRQAALYADGMMAGRQIVKSQAFHQHYGRHPGEADLHNMPADEPERYRQAAEGMMAARGLPVPPPVPEIDGAPMTAEAMARVLEAKPESAEEMAEAMGVPVEDIGRVMHEQMAAYTRAISGAMGGIVDAVGEFQRSITPQTPNREQRRQMQGKGRKGPGFNPLQKRRG